MTLMELIEPLMPRLSPEVFQKGVEEGIEKGIEKGVARERRARNIEIAKALLIQGVGIDIISKVTTLAKVEIKKLHS